jgi:hypothetical protein
LDVGGKRSPCVRQIETLSHPLKEVDSILSFQRLDVKRNARLADGEILRRPGEAEMRRHSRKDANTLRDH